MHKAMDFTGFSAPPLPPDIPALGTHEAPGQSSGSPPGRAFQENLMTHSKAEFSIWTHLCFRIHSRFFLAAMAKTIRLRLRLLQVQVHLALHEEHC